MVPTRMKGLCEASKTCGLGLLIGILPTATLFSRPGATHTTPVDNSVNEGLTNQTIILTQMGGSENRGP